MTRDEAIELLEKRGIKTNRRGRDLYLADTGERVGEIVKQYVYLAEFVPSETGMTYGEIRKEMTVLDSPRASIRLEILIRDLRDSKRRYEQKIRDDKIRAIKMYFKEKKERYMRTMMGSLTDALNGVRKRVQGAEE
jgi:hypothetical protein